MAAGSTAIPGGMPSTTTPTPGPCDSPKVVTTNNRPNEDDMEELAARARAGSASLGCARAARLSRLMGGDAAGAERLVVRHQPFELIEVGGAHRGPRLVDPGLAALPADDVLAGVVEEQLGVQHA